MTPGNTAMVPTQAGTVQRQGLGTQEMAKSAETATTAAAAHAEALVKARYSMAMMRPRDLDDVRTRILKECKRTRFAEVARYSKPVGNKPIVGPSIRFAEAAARCMGNIDVDTPVTYEDEEKRIVRCMVTDLESNVTYAKSVTVSKVVERKNLKQGQAALGQRTNSYGEMVYLVAATDDELLNKQSNLESKAIRTLLLRVIPGDITEEAMDEVVATLKRSDAVDPDAAKKRATDAFASLNIMPSALAKYLGHEVGMCAPSELAELRAIYSAIKDGETTWDAVLRSKVGDAAETSSADKPASSGVAGVKAALARKKAASAEPSVSEEEQAAIAREERDDAGIEG